MRDELPPELLRQLGKRTLNEQFDAAILGLFHAGPLSIDHVLIGLWRADGVVRKRGTIMNKLYRMMLAGQLAAVPGSKGTYRIPAGSAGIGSPDAQPISAVEPGAGVGGGE